MVVIISCVSCYVDFCFFQRSVSWHPFFWGGGGGKKTFKLVTSVLEVWSLADCATLWGAIHCYFVI